MLGPAAIARWALRTQVEALALDGLERIPRSGPVLLVARHFHHLLDGAVLVRHVPRPVHIVVALDWTPGATQRRWMEWACASAQYPVVLRPATLGERAGYRPDEFRRYARAGREATTSLLRAGRVVLVFPEGYPNVDPTFARKRGDDDFLPFAGGYRRMIATAQRDGLTRVAVVPVGFAYRRATKWSIVARFGEPRYDPSLDEVEATVRALSLP